MWLVNSLSFIYILHIIVKNYFSATISWVDGYFLFFVFWLFRATPMAHGGSQDMGLIGATAASLHHSHSKAGSKLSLRPTPQLTTMPDPELTEPGQGSNLSYSCQPTPQPQQRGIRASSANYHHSLLRRWILNPMCWPGMEPVSQHGRDTTDPLASQQEHLMLFSAGHD